MYGVFITMFNVLFVVPLLNPRSVDGHVMVKRDVSGWEGAWNAVQPQINTWSVETRLPMNKGSDINMAPIDRMDISDGSSLSEVEEEGRGKHKHLKKYKKYMLPLLLAYKLKFFTLIPVLIGGLILLTGATGLAGFFFALFAATMGLKGGGDH